MSNQKLKVLEIALVIAVSHSLVGCNGDSVVSISSPSDITTTGHFSNNKNISSRRNGSNQIIGTISSVSVNSFVVKDQTIRVTPHTLIDDSIIENARGVEISNDMPLGRVPENLHQLLPVGLNVEVQLNSTNGFVAISIEDK